MNPKKIKRCVLYARISRATEESVSIERQIEAGTRYAQARGWDVVGTFVDEGVSATYNKPEDRKGWRDLLTTPAAYDAVVVWKVDRLARRVVDFLNANDAVKARNAGIVAVEDHIDLTTAQGEAFATMLAVFGQMESASIRARLTAARDYLLRNGRYVGGVLPYGYRGVPNPDGPGHVIVQVPEQIAPLREAVRRTMEGNTVYSTMQWLNAEGIPTKTGKVGAWRYNTLDRLLRHPLLAGMMPHNPGNTTTHVRGDEVLRDEDGLPVIDEDLAIMPVSEWRALQAKLDEPTPQKAPRSMKGKGSPLLSGLLWCADPRHPEPVKMYRGNLGTTANPDPMYTCRDCHQTIRRPDELIVPEFLRECGDQLHLSMVEEVLEGGSVQMREASVRLAELGRELVTAESERVAQIMAEVTRLKELQEEAKSRPARRVTRLLNSDDVRTFAEDYEAATDDAERRRVLGQAIGRVLVHRGTWGSNKAEDRLARLEIEWTTGQVTAPPDEVLAEWADWSPGAESPK